MMKKIESSVHFFIESILFLLILLILSHCFKVRTDPADFGLRI
jgi:hypothetical protein